jgi:hypothetical protein
MTADWTDYPLFTVVGVGLSSKLSRADAQARHKHSMAVKEKRKAVLAELTKRNGIELENSYQCFNDLNVWFRDNISLEPGHDDKLLAEWYSFTTDLNLYMGDCLIERYPWLRWALQTTSKRASSYQSSVIRGYRQSEITHVEFNLNFARWGLAYVTDPHYRASVFAGAFINGEDLTAKDRLSIRTAIVESETR